MKKLLHWLAAMAFNAAPLCLLLAWQQYDSAGALNVMAFLVWVVLLPIGLIAGFTESSGRKGVIGKHAARWFVWPVRIVTAAALVWFGMPFTAMAYLVHMLGIWAGVLVAAKDAKPKTEAGAA